MTAKELAEKYGQQQLLQYWDELTEEQQKQLAADIESIDFELMNSLYEAAGKPVYAMDEENKPKAYIRIDDENILATLVHLKVWQHTKKQEGAFMTFTEKEQHLLDVLKEKECLTLNQCCKYCKASRLAMCNLLADFIRFGLVSSVFQGHKFYFKLNEE